MDREKCLKAHQWVRDELKGSADFWLRHGLDHEHGGVYTCLDRKGEIFSTDKSVWMQGRCGWIYAFLCTNYGVRPQWLEASKSCVEFLEDHCVNHAAGDRLYFTVTGDGRPLRRVHLPGRRRAQGPAGKRHGGGPGQAHRHRPRGLQQHPG